MGPSLTEHARCHLGDRSVDEGCPRLHRAGQGEGCTRLNGVAALLGDQGTQGTVGSSSAGQVDDVARGSLAEPVAPGERACAETP